MTAATTMPDLRALPAVGLAELVEAADRQVRVDRKYVLPRAALDRLVDAATGAGGVRALEIDDRRAFGYSSLYFDTPDLHCFRAAGQGRRRRFKVRTRDYLGSGDSWLEVKVRGPRDTTVKERMPSAPGLRRIAGEDAAFVAGRLRAHGIDDFPSGRLRPRLATTYVRSTLLLDGASGGDRATIDVDVTWESVGTGRRLSRPDLAIVETKAGSTPTSLDRLLWSQRHRPTRVSKYGVGVAALEPDAPDLKWHRVLARDVRR